MFRKRDTANPLQVIVAPVMAAVVSIVAIGLLSALRRVAWGQAVHQTGTPVWLVP